jgi:hypothetical protein
LSGTDKDRNVGEIGKWIGEIAFERLKTVRDVGTELSGGFILSPMGE